MPCARVDGLTLEYESLGDPAAPAIVLVMGLGVQMILWPDAFCEMLAQRGFRVVRFDNRDIGLSTSLDHLGAPRVALEALRYAMRLPVRAPYLVDDMARDTLGLMDALGLGRAHLVGASLGGMIAQSLAAMAPRRVASLTSMMSTTGRRSLPRPTPAAARALMRPQARIGDFEGAVRRMMNVLRTIASRSYPPDEAALRELCERHVRRSYNPAGAARQLLAIAASGDRSAAVARIAAPTLVLHGDEDPLLKPACGVETARVIRAAGGDAALEIVEGMGHDMPVPLLPRLAGIVAAHCENAGKRDPAIGV